MQDNNIHVTILSETWTKDRSYLNLTNYNVYIRDRNDRYCGVGFQ